MRTLNEQTFYAKDIDASGGAQVDYTPSIDLAHAAGYSAHFVVTRTAAVLAGTVINQKSNDGVTWIDITTVAVADVASQVGAFEVADIFYRFARLKISTASGKASIAINLTTKGF